MEAQQWAFLMLIFLAGIATGALLASAFWIWINCRSVTFEDGED